MDAARCQAFRTDAFEARGRGRRRSASSLSIGLQAFVHLWLILVILGALSVLALSMPLTSYWATIAGADLPFATSLAH